MQKYFDLLQTVGLFRGMNPGELDGILKCIGAEMKTAAKHEILLLAGETPRHVGILLSGQLYVTREDYDGNRALLAAITPGGIFAEALCCAGVTESPVTVQADCSSTVLMIPFSRILRSCPNACAYHTKLIENMLGLVARKNLQLQNRMEIVGLKTVRAKVLHYLNSFLPAQGRSITIPFNREEMADFLCVERSALSHTLAAMQREGLIEYRKNQFTLK